LGVKTGWGIKSGRIARGKQGAEKRGEESEKKRMRAIEVVRLLEQRGKGAELGEDRRERNH